MNLMQQSDIQPTMAENPGFIPRLALFHCQFNHYSQADFERIEALGTVRVKRIQVPCAGRISPLLILAAVQGGVDGIVISGCRPGKCHFKQGNLAARRQLTAFCDLMVYVGLEPGRLRFVWLDPADRGQLTRQVEELSQLVRSLGPARRLVTRPRATLPMGVY
jgi:F420-non-reducing hydrogenase iron-sulfur subunit